MNTETARFNMIEQQIRPWDVLDAHVLALLANMRREDFVPQSRRAMSFMDVQIPLLDGQADGPRMLEPKLEARILQALALQRHESALEIGTGSGFMAALMSHRAMQVHTLECDPELAARARTKLRRSGLLNVEVHEVPAAQGALGLADEAPFDAIALSGSVAAVPRALLEQLKVGGRLVAVVGYEPVMVARLFTRAGPTEWSERDLFDTVVPRLQGFVEPGRFTF